MNWISIVEFIVVVIAMDRLLVVSNRLPVTLKHSEQDGWIYKPSSGGLVAGLAGMKKMTSFFWIGWPGFEVPPEHHNQVSQTLLNEYSAIPVFLSDALSDPFYNIFANSILWPLFHYLPVDMSYDEASWASYVEANTVFADVIMEHCKDNDMIWIHDYQLMVLPRILRTKLDAAGMKNARFAVFTARILPVGNSILQGILAADLVGFHTYEYGRHFLSACSRLLNLQTLPTQVRVSEDHIARIGIYPIGIDPEPFIEATSQPSILERMAALRQRYAAQKIILGVDRLDYIKGIQHKLIGFEYFLRKYPHYRNKVILLQVAVPTREDVDEYKNLIAETNALVGHINGKYGGVDYIPLHFINNSVPFSELATLYALADVCLVTSVRDGMNLVSYEFVAAQPPSDPGVLVLSEFAGAAQSFNGALIINPWDTQGLAKTLVTALEMPLEQRESAYQSLFRWVTKYTSAFWGMGFISELTRCSPQPSLEEEREDMGAMIQSQLPSPLPSKQLELLVMDKDGRLLEHRPMILSDEKPRPHMLHLVSSLASLPHIRTFVMSGGGRPLSLLLEWFGSTGAGIVDTTHNFYRGPRRTSTSDDSEQNS